MPLGGSCRRPYPELPAGEVEGRASESRGEKLPHLLPASAGRGGGPASPAGPGERLPALQLSNPGTYNSVCVWPCFNDLDDTTEHSDITLLCSLSPTGGVCHCGFH